MLTLTKFFFLVLIGQPILSVAQLYKDFETYPQPNATIIYNNLRTYINKSKAVYEFPFSNKSIDYTSDNWMDPCYVEFYKDSANKYILFWIKDQVVTCEVVSSSMFLQTLRYPVEYLMRVERSGKRCP